MSPNKTNANKNRGNINIAQDGGTINNINTSSSDSMQSIEIDIDLTDITILIKIHEKSNNESFLHDDRKNKVDKLELGGFIEQPIIAQTFQGIKKDFPVLTEKGKKTLSLYYSKEKLIDQIPKLRKLDSKSMEFEIWKSNTKEILGNFGHRKLALFNGIEFEEFAREHVLSDLDLEENYKKDKIAYQKGLNDAEILLKSMILYKNNTEK